MLGILHGPRALTEIRLPSKKRKRIEVYLQSLRKLPVLPYDSAAAEWHAVERARLTALGKSPRSWIV
jgi:tRNA(fMet)-specific endonuclease VapC